MVESALLRFLELLQRELGAQDAWLQLGGKEPDDERVIWHGTGGITRVMLRLAQPPADRSALEARLGEPRKAALVWKPQSTVAIDDENGEKLLELIETLNEHDDVQNVYANFEVSDALMQKLSA